MSWRRFFHRRDWDRVRNQELDSYLQIETANNLARGMSAEEARAAAHRKLGNTTRIREEIYTMNSLNLFETLLQDLRYGARSLRKNPGFALVAILTLALGIGANTAMFSVLNGVVLRPLPYKDPSQLVMVWTDLHAPSFNKMAISAPEFADFRDNTPFFSGIGAFTDGTMTMTGHGDAESLTAAFATPSLFSVLGMPALHGRTFSDEEGTAGHEHVAVLSYGFWQTHFGGNPSVLGQSLSLDQTAYTIIGIMPPGFDFPEKATQVWVPQVLTADLLSDNNRGSHFLGSVARLRPGVTRSQAQAQLATLSQRMGHDHPQTYPLGYSARLTSLESEIVGDAPRALWILLAAVGVVLLIACANLANLLLARASARRREFALRAALGARRLRIVRQLLTESCLLAVVGGLLGLAIAWIAVPVLLRLGGDQVPRASEVHIDATVILFTFAVSIIAVLLFGLAPAFQGSFTDVQQSLKEGDAHAPHGSRARTRNVLVAAQVAAALMLLVGAGMLVRSFLKVTDVDPGFAPSRLLTFRVPLSSTRYHAFVPRANFYSQLLDHLSALPGVQSAGAINALPFSGYNGDRTFLIEGRPVAAGEGHPDEQLRFVSPGYFRAMAIPLLRGRDFSAHDNADSSRVVIVNQALADRYWPDGNVLGQHLAYSGVRENKPDWCEIVGVVGNVHHSGLESAEKPEIYLPMLQPLFNVEKSLVPNMFIAVRTSMNPMDFINDARAAVAKLDSSVPIANVMTMNERISESESSRRFQTLLLAGFAGMALLLAAIGIYGVTAYAVQQRRREFGVRLALGAQASHIVGLVLTSGGRLVLAGGITGLLLAAVTARVLKALLFKVAVLDAASLVLGALFLGAVALAACWIPARRALDTDPVKVLRSE